MDQRFQPIRGRGGILDSLRPPSSNDIPHIHTTALLRCKPIDKSSIQDVTIGFQVLEATLDLDFDNSPLIQLRDEAATRAMEIAQLLYQDDELWRDLAVRPQQYDRSLIPPLLLKIAHESRAPLPEFMVVECKNRGGDFMAHGGRGSVRQATLNGKLVAIKCIAIRRGYNAAMLDQMTWDIQREALILCNLNHPSVLPFIGIDLANSDTSQTIGVVLPWYDTTFREYLSKAESLEVIHILQQLVWIVQGLIYLHDRGVIHGDIKALNVLVDANGYPKISDFGISVFEGPWNGKFGSKRSNTALWAAPELIHVHEDMPVPRPTRASDVYSFALLVIETFTRASPYTYLKIRDGIVKSLVPLGLRPAQPKDMPNSLYLCLRKCWRQDAHDRISMFEAGESLAKVFLQYKESHSNHDPIMPPIASLTSPLENTQEIVDFLREVLPEDQIGINSIPQTNSYRSGNQTTPSMSNPVYIFVDEHALWTGLLSLHSSQTLNYKNFSWSRFKYILERDRPITGSYIFLRAHYTQGGIPPWKEELGYGQIPYPEHPHAQIEICIAHVREIIRTTHPDAPRGTMVFMSGGGEHWLDDLEFHKCIEEAKQDGWRVEIFAWKAQTPVQIYWYNFVMPRLEFYCAYLDDLELVLYP